MIASLLMLARPEDLPKIRATVARYGHDDEKQQLAETQALFKSCHSNVACYLGKLLDEAAEPFTNYKAAQVLGKLGNQQTAMALVNALDVTRKRQPLYLISQVIEALLPDGSASVANALASKLEQYEATFDEETNGNDQPLATLLGRLRARQSGSS